MIGNVLEAAEEMFITCRAIFCLFFPHLSTAIAEVLGSKASMSRDKYKTLCCLESAAVNSIITMNWKDTLLHILPMMQINFKVCLEGIVSVCLANLGDWMT